MKSQKKSPFNVGFKTLKVVDDGGRAVWVVDLADSHYGTCPHAKEFTKKKPAARHEDRRAAVTDRRVQAIELLLDARNRLRGLFKSLSVAEDLAAVRAIGGRLNEALKSLGHEEKKS